jgi:hypothetical protein
MASNVERRHSHLGYVNPVELEIAFTNIEAAA